MRKRSREPGIRMDSPRHSDTLDAIAKRWVESLRRDSAKTYAKDLYAGRSFSEGRTVARILGSEMYIVSAGLGLIYESEKVPNYSMTVAEGDGSLLPLFARMNATPAEWWRALHDARDASNPICQVLAHYKSRLALLAVPSSYLSLVRGDLEVLGPDGIERLRIFTSPKGIANLPPHLRTCAMPYDERLEGAVNYAGTRNDFPQRALRHFVEKLRGHLKSNSEGARLVRASLTTLKKPVLPERSKRSDEEIASLIRKNWKTHGGSSTKLLRFLRDDVLVACEQSRFRDLWQTVRATQSTGTMTI